MSEVTTVKVTKKTKGRLAELGKKDETYDDIIARLLEFYDNSPKVVANKKPK